MQKIKTTFILNGEERVFYFDPRETLLEALRNTVGIKSLKCGCDRGDCGTCTIIVDDVTVKSCLSLGVEMDGHEVTTLEGIMPDGELNALQESFLQKNSFQCGFCAPGMVMSAYELLKNNPTPNDHAIKEGIGGNLCRCTGYIPIIDGIKDCVEKGGLK